MAKKDAQKLLKEINKYVGKNVRKQIEKVYSKTTFTSKGVAEGVKQGYESIYEKLQKENAWVEITKDEWLQIGRAGVHEVMQWAVKDKTTPHTIYSQDQDHVEYLAKKDVKRPHTLCKNACVKELNKIRQRKGQRSLKGKQKGEYASHSEVGIVKSRSHKLHMDKTTVGSARLAASMDFLSRTKNFAGFAGSEAAKDLMDLYGQIEFMWVVEGTKKGTASYSLNEGQTVSMEVGSQKDNPPGQEPFDWKNLKQIFADAVEDYLIEAKLADRKGSKSIRENAVDKVEHIVISELTKSKNAKAKRKTKNSTRKKQTTKDIVKSTAVGAKASKKKARTAVRKSKKKVKQGAASSPLHLIGLINKELPNTVRKNMGAPRLENQTGRFAASVRITDIVQTPKGYPSIGYTYQRNPYGVFEDGGGTSPWADGDRDPRELIDRSIREVAAQFAIGRFYTRRE